MLRLHVFEARRAKGPARIGPLDAGYMNGLEHEYLCGAVRNNRLLFYSHKTMHCCCVLGRGVNYMRNLMLGYNCEEFSL